MCVFLHKRGRDTERERGREGEEDGERQRGSELKLEDRRTGFPILFPTQGRSDGIHIIKYTH